MARAGQPLDDWQADAVELILAHRADGKFACFEYAEVVSRQAGKGAILEARALTGLLLLSEQLIMWSAHEYKTALEAFRRVRQLLRNLGREVNPNLVDVDGVLIKVNNTNGEESFERLDTGARIKFLARSKGSGRGFSGDCNIIDETFAYTRDQQDALMPTLMARPNAQIIYTSTPPLNGTTGEVMYALRKRALAGGDDSLGFRDWGLPQDLECLHEVNLDDRTLWHAVNPALGGARVTEETVAKLRRSMGPEGFAREVLCMWPREVTAGAGAISPELWQDLAVPPQSVPEQLAIAIVVNKARTHSYLGYAGLLADGRVLVALAERPRRGTDGVVGRLVQLKAERDPVAIAVDTRSEALLVEMQKAGLSVPEDPDKPERGDLAVMTANQVAAAFGMFVDAAQQRRLAHPDDAAVTAALLEAGTRSLAGGTAWDDAGASVEIAPLRAVTAALWALESRAHLIDNAEELEPWVGFG